MHMHTAAATRPTVDQAMMPGTRILLLCLLAICATRTFANELTWFSDGRLTPQATAVLHVLDHADDYGLDPASYRLSVAADRPDDRARFDTQLTHTLARFVQHIHAGRIAPDAVEFHLPKERRTFDAKAAALSIARAGDVDAALAALEPAARPYRQLKAALRAYRELARRPELTKLIRPALSLRPGDVYEDAPRLRALLLATQDLALDSRAVEPTQHYSPDLVGAIERFQVRHGLQSDGVVGRATFAALTTPFSARVAQIELTLERWRWTSALERPDIVVNVPQYLLFALPREPARDRALEMRVIVGQAYPHTRTPVFTAALTHVIFQPYWDVPASIVRRELLAPIRKNPAYLERHHMEIVQGQGDDARPLEPTAEAIELLARGQARLRQRPGSDNALGRIKFMLPNPYNVYLHATPAIELFARNERAFSHGCIRVSDPAALAGYVLKNAPDPWDEARIEAALCAAQTVRVDLARPLRVLIFYGTAAATDSLGLMFFRDIYGYDERLARALARAGA